MITTDLDTSVRRDPVLSEPAPRLTMVLADRCAIMIEGLKQILGLETGFQILATSSDEQQFARTVQACRPDVFVLTISSRKSEFSILEELHGTRQAGQLATRVVVLADALDEDGVLRAIRLGVNGVVLKEMAPSLLVRCIRKVHAGGTWVENHSIGLVVERMLRRESAALELARLLTAREVDVVRHVASGRTNKQIAADLHVSEGTIKTHLHHVYEKLNVRGRAQVMLYARNKYWV